MNEDDDRGALGRPEDVKRAVRGWAILLGAAATLFIGAAILTAGE